MKWFVSALAASLIAVIPAHAQYTAKEWPEGPMKQRFADTCGVCHEDDLIRQQRLTRADWNREIDKMIGWGARLNVEDRARFLDYLSGNFGPRSR